VTATGEYKNIGLPRMKQIAAHCSGNVQATELVTVSGRQEGNKLKVLLAMTYGSPFTWACTGPGAKLIKPPYPFDFLSTPSLEVTAEDDALGHVVKHDYRGKVI
jgi:hypothetical protein